MKLLTDNTKAVIFDLDGTLVDSMWMWKKIDIDFLHEYGYQVPERLQEDIEGMSFTETAHYFKNRFDIPLSPEEIKNKWNQMAYSNYSEVVELKPGTAEFLKYLKDSGIHMAIASSNSRYLIDAVLKAHDIQGYFDVIVTGCDVKAGKPAPDVYLKAAELLNQNPCECVVFEDVPAGIAAGKAAGMLVAAVEDDYSADMMDKKAEMADVVIRDYEQLLKVLRKEN